MSFQKTLWAGIAIGLGVAVLAGVVGLFATGTVPTPDIARLLATASHTPTLTPALTPTLSAEALCRANLNTYVSGMSDILLIMIDTDETKPNESAQAMRKAQSRMNQLKIPECADAKLEYIDKGIRSALPYYIDWADTLVAGDVFRARDYEASGDNRFRLYEFTSYLEKEGYTDELQRFNKSASVVATKTASYPTRTPVTALRKYQACVKEVFSFLSIVNIKRTTALAHLDTLDVYARGGTVQGIDPEMINRFSESTYDIEPPTCILGQTHEVTYFLRLTADTLKQGFVEVKIETDNGRPDAQSRRRVQTWVKELRTYDRELDVSLKEIPKSLAEMLGKDAGVAATPEPSAVDETIDDKPLEEYSLQNDDLPAGMSLVKTKNRSIEDVAKSWDDPVTALANFKRIGRFDSFQAQYQRSEGFRFDDVGTDLLTVGVTGTSNAANSHELLEFLLLGNPGHVPITIPINKVDQTVSLNHTESCAQSDKILQCNTVTVYMRKGNIVAQIIAYAYTGNVDVNRLTKYAQTIADRMNP